MHLQEIHYLTFDLDLRVKVTINIAQYPLHYMTYNVCTCKVLSKYLQWLKIRCIYKKIHLTLIPRSGLHKFCSVPFTLCDLCTYKVCSCYVQRFKVEMHLQQIRWTDGCLHARTDRRATDRLLYEIKTLFFLKKKRV